MSSALQTTLSAVRLDQSRGLVFEVGVHFGVTVNTKDEQISRISRVAVDLDAAKAA